MTACPALPADRSARAPAALAPAALVLNADAPARTEAVGRTLARALSPGDVVALHGPLGAGKSHLARAIIRERLGDPAAEVPSPSYTLVNIYDIGTGEIWHADLYRVGPDELDEIGLSDAPPDAVMLVEWAERWRVPPARRLDIALGFAGAGAAAEARRLTVTPNGPGWDGVLGALGALGLAR